MLAEWIGQATQMETIHSEMGREIRGKKLVRQAGS